MTGSAGGREREREREREMNEWLRKGPSTEGRAKSGGKSKVQSKGENSKLPVGLLASPTRSARNREVASAVARQFWSDARLP